MDQFNRSWYCGALKRTNEPMPPLTGLNKTRQAFRLIWLRSFHPGIVIRVEIESSGSATLTASQMRVNRGSAGDLVRQKTVRLQRGDIARLERQFSEDAFWKQPHQFHLDMGFGSFASPIPPANQMAMLDGAVWILEGVEAHRYQVMGDGVDSPPVQLGKVLLNLAQSKIPTLAIYPIY